MPGHVTHVTTRCSTLRRVASNKAESAVLAVYTRHLKHALRVCEALETGMIGLNHGIREYLEVKYIAVNTDQG
jgi:acyl-CoA reductase-like NAD-dependent aldehyde dehydrogenase